MRRATRRVFLVAVALASLASVTVRTQAETGAMSTTPTAAPAPSSSPLGVPERLGPHRPIPSTTTTTVPPPPTPEPPPAVQPPIVALEETPPAAYAAPAEDPYVSIEPCGGDLPPCYVKMRESHGNYQALNASSGASGAWQFIDSTWAGYGGYSKAMYAPPEVQDQKAREVWAGGAGCSHWSAC